MRYKRKFYEFYEIKAFVHKGFVCLQGDQSFYHLKIALVLQKLNLVFYYFLVQSCAAGTRLLVGRPPPVHASARTAGGQGVQPARHLRVRPAECTGGWLCHV